MARDVTVLLAERRDVRYSVNALLAALDEAGVEAEPVDWLDGCLLYTSPSPRD